MKIYRFTALAAAALIAIIFFTVEAQERSARPDSGFHHHSRQLEIQPLLNPDSTEIYRISGDTVFVNSVRLGQHIRGYRDVTPVEIAIVGDKVTGITLLNNHESRGYIRKITAAGFFDSWNGLSVKEAQALQVDAVTGATFSSNAIRENVSLALNYYQQQNLGSLVSGTGGQTRSGWLYPIGAVLFIVVAWAVRRKKQAGEELPV